MSMACAASEGLVWVCGPFAARDHVRGLCCVQRLCDPSGKAHTRMHDDPPGSNIPSSLYTKLQTNIQSLSG